MRKLISLILVLITLFALCVPAMAEEEPYETVPYVYSTSGGSEHFSFYSNRQDSLENAWVAGDENWYFKLFADEKSGLQIKDIELRYVNGDFANAAISRGTKVDPDKDYQRGDWLRINNIHSKVFTLGTEYKHETVTFDEIRVYYESAKIIEEDHEIIYYDFSGKSFSENFCLDYYKSDYTLDWEMNNLTKIYSRYNNYQIKRLEIFLHIGKLNREDIIVSNGNCRENGAAVSAGGIIHIDDIHSPSVSFGDGIGGTNYGTDVIVYYEPVGTGSVISGGVVWIVTIIGGTAIIGAAALIIVKKKKQKAVEE